MALLFEGEFLEIRAAKETELRKLAAENPEAFRRRIHLDVAKTNISHPEWAEGGVPMTPELALAWLGVSDLADLLRS